LVQHLYILCITNGLYTLLFWLYKSCTKYLYVPELYCIAYVQSMYTQMIVYRLFRILYIATLYKLHFVVVNRQQKVVPSLPPGGLSRRRKEAKEPFIIKILRSDIRRFTESRICKSITHRWKGLQTAKRRIKKLIDGELSRA